MRKFYAGFFCLSLLLLWQNKSFAQVSTYSFSHTTGTYTAISGTTSTAAGDDGTQGGIPIGFNFIYDGTVYTHFAVTTNGFIKLGTTNTVAITGTFGGFSNALFPATTDVPAIAPLWDDMNQTGGNIQYLVTGAVGSRVLTVQWTSNHWSGSGSGTAPTNSYQVQLVETTNVIRFVYGTMNGSASGSATIGMNSVSSGFQSVTPAAAATSSNSVANNTISAATFLPTGTTYTFTPPSCVPPTGTSSSAITTNSATISWNPATPVPGVGYEWEVRSSGAAGSGATGLAASGSTLPAVTTVNVTGLNSSTSYSIYVRSVCAVGTNSAWTAASAFSTLSCAPNINQTPSSICPNGIQTITVTGQGSGTQTFSSGTINLSIPDNNPTGITTPAIAIPASSIAGASNLKIRINATHSWTGDLIFRVNAPCGTTYLFDRPGVPQVSTVGNLDNLGGVYEFDVSAATVLPEVAATTTIPPGSYRPSDVNGVAHNWAGLSFPCAAGGNWTLTISDNAAGDLGTLASWEIITTVPTAATATFTPATGLFTNPGATVPYVAGTPVSTVYASVATTTNYTAVDPTCPGSPVNFSVTVSPVTSITTHPNSAAVVCAGSATSLTVAGAGTGTLTYQWQISTDGGGTWNNIANAAPYGGVTTTTLNINPVAASMSGNQYRAIVTGTCGNATSNAATLTVDQIAHTAVSGTPDPVCSGSTFTVTGTAVNGVMSGGFTVLGSSGTVNLGIPDNNPTGLSNTIVLPAYTFTNAADLRVRVNLTHTWIGDLTLTLTSPCGTTFLINRPGVPVSTIGNSMNFAGAYTFTLSGATVIPEVSLGSAVNVPVGNYLPSDVNGNAHNWAGLTFPCNAAGNWQLSITDGAAGDVGTLASWDILAPSNDYTHTLTGPGTITQGASTGPNNSTANFTVTAMTPGNQVFTLTSTDPYGCSVSTQIPVLVNQTPVITLTQTPNPICNGQVQTITANVVPSINPTYTQLNTINIPGAPATTGAANPYSSDLTVAGLPTGVTVKSVKLGNFNHAFPDDVDIVLVSPSGQAVILMSDVGGSTPVVGLDYTFDDAAASLMADAAFNPQGTYRPTNIGAGDVWVAPAPASPSATTLSTFTGNMNGVWKLFIVDDASGSVGFVGNWAITFNVPTGVVFTPNGPGSGLYSDPAATIVYNGALASVVYAKPATTTVYTATTTLNGCTGTATATVTVNQLPAITVQPTPATQTVCPGATVSYSVTATGTGISYQWRRNGVNLVNGGFISGATTPTLTISTVAGANSGNYDVVVSGTCSPAAVSNTVVLNVGTAPVISTQPANRTVCVGQTASFTVATTGSIPAPNIFQWQQSTDNGATWTNLTTGGSYTATYTTPATTAAMNNYRYRVIVTNSCGQSTTTNAAILTVNPAPTVTATPLANRICISDTLIPLVGSPTGGSWSGVGVSGFNFVPTATAVGTYNLTYTYTNAQGCTNTAVVTAKVEDCQERLRLLSDDAVILYPNPNNGMFNIRINSTLYNYLGMKVYNAQGQLLNGKAVNDILVSPVYTGLVYGRVIPIDLTHLPSGIYMVKFYYDDGVRTSEKGFKVVIAR